jgi:hypothetical protein
LRAKLRRAKFHAAQVMARLTHRRRSQAASLLALGIALAAPASGQAASLTARLDREVVPVGEMVTLALIFEGVSPNSAPNLPPLPNLNLQSVGQASEFSIVNGQTTSKQTFNYTLQATQPGDITIPPMQITLGGQVLTSQPLKLKIVKDPVAAVPNAAQNQAAFLRLLVPRTNVYVGEPFAVEMQLYWQDAEDLRVPQLKADGFSLGKSAEPQQTTTRVGNAGYRVAIFRTAVTAARSGTLTLGPAQGTLSLRVPVGRQPRDPFDPFSIFGPRVQLRPTTLTSESVLIQVSPLPTQDVPETFNGAVGNFSLSVTASPTNVAVGDPITVRAQVRGRGLVESLTLPSQPHWRDFNIYPPTSTVDLSDPLGLSGTKTFTNVVVPLNHEIKALPPLQFAFFDLETRTYRTLSGPTIALNVRPSPTVSAVPPAPTNAAAPRGEAPAPDDVIHIRARLDAVGPSRPPLLRQAWFLALQGVPVLAWASLLARRWRRETLENNPRLRRQREAAQRVREGLQNLRVAAQTNQSEAFFVALFRVLQEQLGERLDMPASAITEAVIEERLRPRGVNEETLRALHELFQTCNLARYAPLKTSQELAALIPRVESALRDVQKLKE